MIRSAVSRTALVVGMMMILSAPAWTQELGPQPTPVPQRLEVSSAGTPIDMLAEEALRLMGASTGQAAVSAAPSPDQPAPGPLGSQGGSRTITVDSPAVVNSTAHFLFRDLTDRAGVGLPGLSPVQRRAVVELYRQSLKPGSATSR
jgi:hypothetical protein